MHYYEVAPCQIFRAQSSHFTYNSTLTLRRGHLVNIEVGKKVVIGVVLKETKKPDYDTKQIASLIEEKTLPEELLATAEFMNRFYNTHFATVLQTILPRGLNKERRAKNQIETSSIRKRTKILLNKDQQAALDKIQQMTPGTAILHGVTGSGKTQVYIELAKQAISLNKSVILLVPEIALTSQLVDEFSQHFTNLILTHSKQTEAERHVNWKKALRSTEPVVAIGPRSALFLPLSNLAFVIIDESHEPSLKQEQSPRYTAQRVASVLTTAHKAKLILGSATPLISDYFLATENNRPVIEMNSRARANATPPTIQLIDMTKRVNSSRHRFFSNKLLVQIESSLAANKQVLIFHNRRGSTQTTLCESCGWTAQCPRCYIPLTLHADKHVLRCHTCAHTEQVPTACPVCQEANIIHKGIGTKLIESELKKLYPSATIARFDGDTSTEETLAVKYKEIYEGDIDIIVGTQIVAKGLDLPHLQTVGIIQADAGLSMPDFSSTERTFQLIAQVIGRVGRSDAQSEVIIQTYQPHHSAITDGITQDYHHFYTETLQERKKGLFPPFTHLLKLTCVFKTEAAAIRNAQQLAQKLRQQSKESACIILGPTPAFYERQHDTYRWQIIVKSPVRSRLVSLLESVPPTHWHIELDPISLL